MYTTQDASDKLASQGIKLSSTQVAQLAKQGIFHSAEKNSGGQWQIPEADLNDFIKYRKKRRRISWGTVIAIITVLGIISITNDFVDLANRYFFKEKPNPSTDSYLSIVSIIPKVGSELSLSEIENGIPLEIKLEYRNALPGGYKQGEVEPFISISSLRSINEDGTSDWREITKEENILFGIGDLEIKGTILPEHIFNDEELTISIRLGYEVKGDELNYSSADGQQIIVYPLADE